MAFTEQDQKDLMYAIVGAFDASPGRTIFNELAASMINDGATIEDITQSLVNHPLFSDNTIGEARYLDGCLSVRVSSVSELAVAIVTPAAH